MMVAREGVEPPTPAFSVRSTRECFGRGTHSAHPRESQSKNDGRSAQSAVISTRVRSGRARQIFEAKTTSSTDLSFRFLSAMRCF
jgi:hypothetical protein